MSVPEQIPYVGYVANGQTTEFPITFDLHDPEYLIVTVNKEIPAVGTYTVDMNALKVVFATAPTDGTQVELYRETELNRDTNYQKYDNSFRPEAVNYDFDKIWHVLQEQDMIDAELLARLKAEIEWRRTHDANFDELAKMRDAQIFSGLKGYVDTLYAASNPNIFEGVTAGIVFALDKKSVQTHLEIIYEQLKNNHSELDERLTEEVERATVAKQELGQSITDTQIDLNNKVNEERNRAIGVEQSLQLQITTGNAGIKYFSTEAELLAFVPTASDPKQAYAFDTKKNYLWKLKSGSTTQYEWKDEGRSTLALANDFSKALYQASTIKTSESDLYHFTASGGEVVAAITEEAILKIVGLDIDGKPISTILDEKNKEIVNPIQDQDLYTLTDSSGENVVWALTSEGRPIGVKPFDLGIDALFAKATSNQEMTQIGLYHDYIKAKDKEAYNFNTTVYVKNDPSDGFTNEKTARMPSVIQVTDSKVFISWVVFDKLAPSDQSHGVMLGRFVDFDLKNKTATVNTNTVVMAGVRGAETEAYRHAVFGKVLNKQTGKFRYICLFNSGSFYNKNVKLLKIYSDDDCQTWSEPVELMTETGGNPVALIPASIIRLENGMFAGRLVVGGFFFSTTEAGQDRVGVLISDDDGETWNVGGTIASGAFDSPDVTYGFLNETSVCCDNSGELLLAIRNEGNSNINQRAVLFARSKDGGNTLYIDSDEPLIRSAVSEVALLQASDSLQTGIPKILLSFPSEPFASVDGYTRRALRIGFSYDNGKSYPLMYTPRSSDGVSGYSHMIALTDQDFVLVEEPTETIRVVFFNMAHVLTNGVLKND
ncbi:phage tail fiber protein [Acinetobacter baumannii]|uniref:phage tail fiber domain-containing protein n=1 Tax=Acinetobacter baumannii TaxID=470 RepID=UPI003AF5AB4D